MKCEVLADKVLLVVQKGSIVEVDSRQYEMARSVLRPVDSEPVEDKPKRKKKAKEEE